MKPFKRNIYSAATLALLMSSSVSFAGSHWPMPTFAESTYTAYEQREPCQFYKSIPQSLVSSDRCREAEPVPVGNIVKLLPVVATYTIYFDFDKSNIKTDQYKVIEQLASELNRYNPTQITVVGHTDTSGDWQYNKQLSAKRADTVSRALTARNINNFYLDEHAVGEENLAIPTPDGTRLAENRRVVIQFRR